MNSKLHLSLSLMLLCGCGGEEVKTYLAPKEAEAAPVMEVNAGPAPAAAPKAQPGFKAELPDGWSEKPGTGMRIVSYGIGETGIDFYLISLSMGDVPSNVNRWRGQVGLSPASPEEIAADVDTFQVEHHDVNFIEIYNEEGGKGIVAAIVNLAPDYWYFTAKGSADELKANVGDIRTFLKSIQFEGHQH